MFKENGEIRERINFFDINKAYLKDDFSLLNIDQFVDLIKEHALMDKFLGYNKININPTSQHKTTFTTP